MKEVSIHTDGSCLRNPGPGGWAAILAFGDVVRELSGSVPNTTNNRMEMLAVIEGLKALKEKCKVTVFSDSKYIVDNIRGIATWKKRGWRLLSTNKPVKNRDMWEALDEICGFHEVTFTWVRGHDGNPGNERADVLARIKAEEIA